MPVCKECKWYSPGPTTPIVGKCNLKLEDKASLKPHESFEIAKRVMPDQDAANCPHFIPGKYDWKDH